MSHPAIMDADAHVVEPEALWRTHIEPRFIGREPVHEDLTFGVFVDGRGISTWDVREAHLPEAQRQAAVQRLNQFFTDKYPEAFAAGFSATSHLADMDRQGVQISVLYPSFANYAVAADWLDPELSAAVARAYNNWLAEFCAAAPDRLRGMAILGLQDPATAALEVRRAVGELGLAGAMVRPNPILGRNLNDPAYDPIYAELEGLGGALGVHEGGRPGLPQAGADRFKTMQLRHVCSHPMEQMIAALSLISGGVLERFPQLRVAFLESGTGWAPYWLWRMDEHWEHAKDTRKPDDAVRLPMAPSEYFRRQCFLSVEPEEPFLRQTIDFFGEAPLVFATDYPHPDSKYPRAVERFLSLPGLTEETRRKILWDNPQRLYASSRV